MHLQQMPPGGRGAQACGEHHGGGLAVHGHAQRAGDGLVDGGGDERVEEFQRLGTAGALPRRGEDAGVREPRHLLGGLGLAEPGDVGRQRWRRLDAEDGDGPGEADGGGAEPGQPVAETAVLRGGDQLAQGSEVDRLRFQIAVADLGGQLDDLEGVAAGHRPALAAERLVGLLAEDVPHDPADPGRGERVEHMRARALPFGEAAHGDGVGGQVLRAVADGEQQGQVHGAGGEPEEPVQGFGVGPVDVVQDHDDRGVLHREPGDQPVQAVAHALRIGRAAAPGDHQAHGGRDDVVPAAQDSAVLLLAGGREHGLEELPYDVERGALFVLAAARRHHGAATVGGSAAHLAEQRGLAEAARPGEGDHSAGAGAGRIAGVGSAQIGQRVVDRREFGLPLQQCPTRPVLPVPHVRHVRSPSASNAERSLSGTLRSPVCGYFLLALPMAHANSTRALSMARSPREDDRIHRVGPSPRGVVVLGGAAFPGARRGAIPP